MKVLLVLMLVVSSFSFAQDAKNGAKLYKKCMSCHGKDGMGKASQKAPMLAGQFGWYIISQVNAIKSGKRSNKNTKKMYPFVKKLTTTDITDLAAYISTLPVKKK